MFSKAYRSFNNKPFSVDNLTINTFSDKIKALKILTLNTYIQLPKNEKLQKITDVDFYNTLIDWIKLCGENETIIDLKIVKSSLLMFISDYYVSEKPMKKQLIRIKNRIKDTTNQYDQLKKKILNTPGVSIQGGEENLVLERRKEFKIHQLNVNAGTENFSFHINLLLHAKIVKQLTNYSLMNILILFSHTLEYFKLLPASYSVANYAYSLKNKYYRIKDHKEKIFEILNLEYELYKTKLELDPKDVSALLDWLESELS